MAHLDYDFNDFVSVRYYQGTYGCTGSSDRYAYYGMTGTPTLMFNGTIRIVGAGDAAATGEGYKDIIHNRSFDPAPIKIEVDSFDPVSGAVGVTVTMYSTTVSLTNENVHIVLFENDMLPGHTEVTRDIYNDTISLTGAGNTATFNTTFTIDPTWNTANLGVIAFVQKQDQEILQTGSSDPQPNFKVRAMVPFSRTAFGPSVGSFETDPLTVMNIGLTDTFTASVFVEYAPQGWAIGFRDEGGTLHTDPTDFGLSGDASTTFKAVVTPSSPGYARFVLVVNSTNLVRPLEIPFTYITDDVGTLIIDDDGGENFEDYFTTPLENAGLPYGVWDRGASALTTEVAQACDLLIWNAGWAFPTLDADDKVFLANYLDSGKALFMSGQDIGWELNDPQGAPDPTWYQTYLKAIYIRDDTNIMYLDGVSGDPITDGLTLHIDGPTGASNQDYPDEITPADADATEILNYQGDGCGAIRSTDSVSGAKLVYLGFGFEGIDDAQDRQDLLVPGVYWLLDIIFRDGFESGTTSGWPIATP